MTETKKYKILCLFTCFNRLEKTRQCIDSLKKNSNMEFEFIAADDNSNDGTKEYLQHEDGVTCLEGNGNLFYTGGMHLAMQTAMEKVKAGAEWDYVMLVNDDVQFYENTVQQMIDLLDGECAVVAGATDDGAGNYTYGGIAKMSKWRPKCTQVFSKDEKIRCDTFNANCVLLSFEIFKSVPIMDGYYQHAFGDYDYGFSISRAGYPIYSSNFYVGKCEDDHTKVNSWEDPTLPRRKRLQLKESVKGLPYKMWFYFLKKNYGLFTAIIYSLAAYVKILIKK